MQIEMNTQDVLKQINKTMLRIKDKMFTLNHINYDAANLKTYKEQSIKNNLELNFYKLKLYESMCLQHIGKLVPLDRESYYTIYEEQYEDNHQ